MTYPLSDTITAIATPIGEGAISIVRLSGKAAIAIADKIFTGSVIKYKSHTAHYGKVINQQNNVIDSVLLLVMKSPNSYTGEDSVEIHCHGGSFITGKVLETLIAAGARSAGPGEFTYRAYRNNKIDLVQAEAVCQLIGAKNELALQAAEDQLEGRFSKKIHTIHSELVSISAQIEADMDYPDEDLEQENREQLEKQLQNSLEKMDHLLKTYEEGKLFNDGVTLCIVGAPNVGKSSLLNALCQKDRAIVTPIPGTTRDLLEEKVKIGLLTYHLIDTAGIRQTDEVIEKEGIKKSQQALKRADIILHLLDATRVMNKEDTDLINTLPKEKTFQVWNKTDIKEPQETIDYALKISAKNQTGIHELFNKIEKKLLKDGIPSKGEIVLTKQRHKEALEAAIGHCQQVQQNLLNNKNNNNSHNTPHELLAEDMRFSLQEIGKILGTDVTEEILSSIFSQFCVGK